MSKATMKTTTIMMIIVILQLFVGAASYNFATTPSSWLLDVTEPDPNTQTMETTTMSIITSTKSLRFTARNKAAKNNSTHTVDSRSVVRNDTISLSKNRKKMIPFRNNATVVNNMTTRKYGSIKETVRKGSKQNFSYDENNTNGTTLLDMVKPINTAAPKNNTNTVVRMVNEPLNILSLMKTFNGTVSETRRSLETISSINNTVTNDTATVMAAAADINASQTRNDSTVDVATAIVQEISDTMEAAKNGAEFLRVHNPHQIQHLFLFERSCKPVLETGGCRCASASRANHVNNNNNSTRSKSRCCCVGPQARQIPQNFTRDVTSLFFYNVGILEIRENDFHIYPRLEEIVIDSAAELRNVEGGAFVGLKNLSKISITNCQNLERWSESRLRDNPKLRSVIARGNALASIPLLETVNVEGMAMELLDFSANLITVVKSNAFREISVRELRLQENRLRRVDAQAFFNSKFTKLSLNDNPELDYISPDAFDNIKRLTHLDLSNTRIDRLPVLGLKNIEHLSLRNVPTLKKLPPVLAFIHLHKAEFTYPYHCCFFKHAARQIQNKKYFQEHYKEIQRRLCLDRLRKMQDISDVSLPKPVSKKIFARRDDDSREALDDDDVAGVDVDDKRDSFLLFRATSTRTHTFTSSTERPSPPPPQKSHESSNFKFFGIEWGAAFFPFFDASSVEEPASDYEPDEAMMVANATEHYTPKVGAIRPVTAFCPEDLVSEFYSNVTCTPQPDALNPCEDIVSYYPLRCVIWVMWISGIIGNIAVWVVIAAVWKRQMRLHYFFMLNVSFADFLTGVYLAILAITDWKTSNEYYNYAVEWQTGWGCSAAGFISVFASQLSIFSMLLIAVEIYYNAKYAFYGRRMSCKAAVFLMGLGYTYSFTMAALPLLGVSTYKDSSICLPLTINSRLDQAYILFGLALSAVAFSSMVANYALINCMIRNREMPSRDEDRQILRRTIVLIGTDMICWLPTLFLGITAALGMPLITLTNAKICLILFYPINSCANPLLYVFLTKIWKDAKQKALPIFEIISSKSQNFSRNNNYHRHHGVMNRRHSRGRRPLGFPRRRQHNAHSKSRNDYIEKFYYSAPPSPTAADERRPSDSGNNVTKALLHDVRARIIADNLSAPHLPGQGEFNVPLKPIFTLHRQLSADAAIQTDKLNATIFDEDESAAAPEVDIWKRSNFIDDLSLQNAANKRVSSAQDDSSPSSSSGASLGITTLFDNVAAAFKPAASTPSASSSSTAAASGQILAAAASTAAAAAATIRAARVSAVPEMSDISESSSNSCERLHNHQKQRPKRQKNGCGQRGGLLRNMPYLPAIRLPTRSEKAALLNVNNVEPTSASTDVSVISPPVKRDSDTSIGRDSGRGDSLTSSVLHFLNRPSVASINWEAMSIVDGGNKATVSQRG